MVFGLKQIGGNKADELETKIDIATGWRLYLTPQGWSYSIPRNETEPPDTKGVLQIAGDEFVPGGNTDAQHNRLIDAYKTGKLDPAFQHQFNRLRRNPFAYEEDLLPKLKHWASKEERDRKAAEFARIEVEKQIAIDRRGKIECENCKRYFSPYPSFGRPGSPTDERSGFSGGWYTTCVHCGAKYELEEPRIKRKLN